MKKEFIAELVSVVGAERTDVKSERTAVKSERTAVKAGRTAVKAERTAVNEVPTKSEIKLKTEADWGDLSQCFVRLKTTKEIKIPTKIEDESPNIFQSVSSKCILNSNLTPVVKLNRNQEIELAIQEGKNQLMRKCVQSVILDMKSEVDQLTVPVVLGEMREIHECMKELMEVNDEDHCEDNAEPFDNDDEQSTSSETNSNGRDFDEENQLKYSSCTFFVCDKCNQCYRSRTLLKTHSCPYTSTKHCNNCFRTFSDENFKTHVCKVQEGMFRCIHCRECFKTKNLLTIHEKYNCSHETYTFKCSDCGERFRLKRYLETHIRKHKDLLNFHCAVCKRAFCQKSHLEVHMASHSEERPYKCDQCDNKTFKRLKSLEHHKQTHSGVKSFQCQDCGKYFFSLFHLKHHRNSTHERQHVSCGLCNKKFARNYNLKLHMRSHTNEKPFVCHCGKAFAQNSSLTLHKRVHDDVKPYKCEKCKAKFKHSSSLVMHIRCVHTNEKPYKCEKCSKTFSQNSNYRTHMRMHAKEYVNCGMCGSMYTTKGNLKLHMKNMHNDRLFKCGVCKKLIKSKYEFQNHTKIHIKGNDL